MSERHKILIADDEPAIRETLEALLFPEGYDLAFAENGHEALEKAAEFIPDLILLDVMMPDMDGFEVCQHLRANQHLAEVPIIIVTALDDRDSRLEGIEAGADDFITKPFDRHELRLRVRTITRLNRYRSLLKERVEKDRLRESVSILEHEAAIGNLSAGVAHDFNNILAVMMGVEFIEEDLGEIEKEIPPEFRKALKARFDRSKRYCKNLTEARELGMALTGGITEFARGATDGTLTQHLGPLVIKPFDIFKRKFKRWEIVLNLDIEQDLPPVRCNGGEIQRAVLNLVTNAVYAMEEVHNVHRRLNVRLRKDGEAVKLSIEDNGTGMPEDVQTRIFDNLFTTKEKGKGTGIGLATVKKIMDSHGGKIAVDSEVGRGTCFVLTFPVT
ncbi:response regulator [Desulfococcaceae bacterium HSG8]|nr:response regulator [Desulfococcaceae bacterium HSG8]